MLIINKKTGLVSEFDGKSAVEIKKLVEEKIAKQKSNAFKHNGWFVVYSGPFVNWINKWKRTHTTDPCTNKTRAEYITKDWGAATIWLDGSPMGQWLEDNKLYDCLQEKNGGFTRIYFSDVDLVMAATSKAYIKKAFGHVATAVCGADHIRMFYSVELKELVKNKRVKTINGLPRELVKKFYDISPDEAFQLVCWAELIQAKQRAEKNPTDATVQEDYKQRLFYFSQEREHTNDNVVGLSPTRAENRRKKRLELFASHAKELTANKLATLLDDIKLITPHDLSMTKTNAKKCAALSPIFC